MAVTIGRRARMRASLRRASILAARRGARREERDALSPVRASCSFTWGFAAAGSGPAGGRAGPTAISAVSGLGAALASDPKLLLLDEPTAGSEPAEVRCPARSSCSSCATSSPLTILLDRAASMKVVMGGPEQITVHGPRGQDRGGAPAGRARRPAGDRGLPRQAGGATCGGCWRSPTSAPITAASLP